MTTQTVRALLVALLLIVAGCSGPPAEMPADFSGELRYTAEREWTVRFTTTDATVTWSGGTHTEPLGAGARAELYDTLRRSGAMEATADHGAGDDPTATLTVTADGTTHTSANLGAYRDGGGLRDVAVDAVRALIPAAVWDDVERAK